MGCFSLYRLDHLNSIPTTPSNFSWINKVEIYVLGLAIGVFGYPIYPEVAREHLMMYRPFSDTPKIIESDFFRGSTVVERAIQDIEGGIRAIFLSLQERLGKKLNAKERIVLFGEIAKNCLLDYMSIYRPKILKDFDSSQNALFLSTRGTRLSVRSIQHRIKNYAKYAGLSSWVHPHTLRHSFATHMMDGGADIRVVQELLGHSSPATTQIYTHVTGAQAVKTYMAAHPAAGIDEEEK